MGRSISHQRYRKLESLRRRGRLCQHETTSGGACAVAATVAIDWTTTNLDSGGLVKSGPHRSTSQFCKRHFRSVLRAADTHGVVDAEAATITYQMNYRNGCAQINTLHLDTVKQIA